MIFASLATSSVQGAIISEEKIAPYEYFLERGTLDHQDWSNFNSPPQSRYYTFKKAFELFEKNNGHIIVELGTSRSFTHGESIGCNSNNPIFWTPDQPENWDWGAGFFTKMVAICLQHLNPEIHTVDLVKSHIERCKIITKEQNHLIRYHVCSSVDYLNRCNFSNGIDLLYLDTGDMTPIEPTALLQLQEVKKIVERNVIAKNGLILIDDVKNQTPKKFGESSDLGKSKYALPYLLQNGFEIVMDEYQVLLRKK